MYDTAGEMPACFQWAGQCGRKLSLCLEALLLTAWYLTPEGRGWKTGQAGWVVSVAILPALLLHLLQLDSCNGCAGIPSFPLRCTIQTRQPGGHAHRLLDRHANLHQKCLWQFEFCHLAEEEHLPLGLHDGEVSVGPSFTVLGDDGPEEFQCPHLGYCCSTYDAGRWFSMNTWLPIEVYSTEFLFLYFLS